MGRADSFWDRRRAAVQAEARAEESARARREADEQQAALADRPDDEILAELNLPDPDSLSMGDDFKAFMAREVPARLRNRALRRLWRSNPVLACVDGLNDYDDDYLTGSTGNGAIATTYQVGKGMLSHIDELARRAEALAQTPAPLAQSEEPAPPAAPTEAPAAPPAEAVADAAPEDDAAAETSAPPRRMRFHFEDRGQA
ncbi:DUF3306 domain-containing protein [Oceaniglobus trochenteri]|uniref:DUF3306 domain-containing protein n=1 Tax=Oceaniglobus trochenteri TaxID=2763260 RepID=UPI001CFFB71C|nr:DUF3306 domain-containing protein [Oceaniglobus trochenteri]